MHFERAIIFLKSSIPLHSDDLMVMSPHGLAAVANPFELNFRSHPCLWLQEACTLFLYFIWVTLTVTSSVSDHVKQSPEADSISESATFSVGASESDEAPLWLVLLSLSRSPVLLEVPTTVPSPGSAVALVGLEGGLVGSCPCSLELGLASGASLGTSSFALCRAVSSPNLDLLGVNTGLLVALITECTAKRAVPLFLHGADNGSDKWASNLGECQQRGYPTGKALEEVGSQFYELDCLRGLGPVIPPAQVLW